MDTDKNKIPFSPEFTLPRFLMEFSSEKTENPDSIPDAEKIFAANWTLQFKNVNPAPFIRRQDSFLEILIGSPILENRIAPSSVLDYLFSDTEKTIARLPGINGEFLIIRVNEKNSKLSLINDRFTSIPVYYIEMGKNFAFSPYFSDIWEWAGKVGSRNLEPVALLEFIYFQRLLGTKTYLKEAEFLPDASILTRDNGKIKIKKYWERDYTKSQESFRDNAQMMANLTRQSLNRKTSDGKRYGHFLSGGLDSRTVLTAFPDDRLPTCFTATIGENREFRTAAKIAETRGARHIGLRLSKEHYGQIYRPATALVGGMYNYDHALFLGFQNIVRECADVCLHGHGFDYMFQGMYIPSTRMRLMGRNLFYGWPKKPPEDLASYFIDNVSYRIKHARIEDFILEHSPGKTKSMLLHEIKLVLEKGRDLTDNPYDLWGYLTFHHISRHYSFPNHASIATYMEQRTPSFDNDLFDFYLSLPMRHRFDGAIEKACLKILNPDIAEIWSANNDLPATATSFRQTVYQIGKAVLRRIRAEELNRESWKERTWISRDYAIRNQPTLRKAVMDCLRSDVLEQVDFLDMEKLRSKLPEWLNEKPGTGISGDLVQTLLTMGTFLEQ